MTTESVTVAQCQEPHSSIELGQTAKGLTQVTVKVYAHDPEQAADEAQRIYDELVKKYAAVGAS